MSQKLINYVMTLGATRDEATMIVDLATNAAEKALDSVALAASVGPTALIRDAAFMAGLRFLHVNIGEFVNAGSATQPTPDAYMAACRAGHWRTAQLRAHGIEPIDLSKVENLTHYPPEDFDFKAAESSS